MGFRKLLGSNRTLTALKTSKRLDKSGFPRGVSETILKQLVINIFIVYGRTS